MKIKNFVIKLETKSAFDFIDITGRVEKFLKRNKMKSGLVNVQSRHTSSAVFVNENEPLLLGDFKKNLEKIFSSRKQYKHDDFKIRTVNMCREECQNGHAHCKALLIGTSVTLNLIGGKMDIGKWQRVFFVELDRARSREISVVAIGN
ncbi:MAG: isopentenyl-diphosphate delta-isomerase, type 2 [uncultured bacterium]|nr:MAG: isopentenyl-diphosphate delta-isomerase, type 2 [uncultured bacterium]